MNEVISIMIRYIGENPNHEYFKVEFDEIEWFKIMEENKIKITDDEFRLKLKEKIKSKFGFDVEIFFEIYDVKRIIKIERLR